MLTRLWSFLTGYVTLIVEGKCLEKLINMGVSRGLYLWDIKWLDSGKVRIKVRLNGIKALRHIARRTQCHFKITGKGGIPFRIARVRKQKILLAGAVLSVILIYMMSSFIWFIDIKGNEKVPAEKIRMVAEQAGLGMGTFKQGLNKDGIEKFIRNEIPEAAWIGIKITGTKAVIEIAEKVIIPPADNSPANIVARKIGLVKEILVLSGKPSVKEGDMVKEGDILISGSITPEKKEVAGETEENPEDLLPMPIKLVRAKGIVRARVWYDAYGESRLVDQGIKRTGRKTEVLSLKILGKDLILKGPKSQPYQEFETASEVKKLPRWRNLYFPVEIVTTNYYEVEKYRDIIGVSEAKSVASQKALNSVRKKIPADAKVARETIEEIHARGSNVIRVKAILETIEDIGMVEPLNQKIELSN